MTHWSNALRRMGACSDAVKWAAAQSSRKHAWETCERADWMLWIIGKTAQESKRKAIVLCACAIARTALKYVPAGEDRPLRAIETAEAWCKGDATIEQVRHAAATAAAAYAAYAADAAYDAAAANAAYTAAYAADAAAAAAATAAYAAADARKTAQKKHADIVRRMLPMPELPIRKNAKAA